MIPSMRWIFRRVGAGRGRGEASPLPLQLGGGVGDGRGGCGGAPVEQAEFDAFAAAEGVDLGLEADGDRFVRDQFLGPTGIAEADGAQRLAVGGSWARRRGGSA